MERIPFGGTEVLTTTVIEAQTVLLHVPSALAKYVVVAVGETVIEVMPLNAGSAVPPHDPLYHFHIPCAPRVPPLIVRVMLSPVQMLSKGLSEVIRVAATDSSKRVTLKLHVLTLL